MNKNLLYYYFSRGSFIRLKSRLNRKRNYVFNYSIEKHDFIFDEYKNKIDKKMLEISELKRRVLKKVLRRKMFKRWIFKKFYIRALSVKIRNELLLTIPGLLYFHKKAKSWKFIQSKLKRKFRRKHKRYLFYRRKKLLRNVKILRIGRYPTYREAVDLRIKLNQLYFWLINTTKRQILTVVKLNKLRKTRDIVNNYINIKRKFFRKRLLFFKKKIKKYRYFVKQKKLYFRLMMSFYFGFYKKMVIFLCFLNKSEIFFKFFFFKYINILVYFFKKAMINKLTTVGLLSSLKEFKPFKKKILKLRRRIKKKLLFAYKVSRYIKKIYKLKVRMVNSNFFITLTDYNDKVILSRSTGQVSGNRKKKVKLSPYLVTRMMYAVLRRLRKLRIKYLYFFVNTKINRHINNVMKILKTFRYTSILKIFFSKPIAHHFGTRKPKLRRL